MKDEVYLSKQLLEFIGREKYENKAPNLKEGLQYVHPEDRDRTRRILSQAMKNRKGYSLEYRIIRKDKTVIYVSEQVELILDENGNPIRLIGITQDITKRKMAEQKLHESEQRFEHIYDNLSLGIRSLDVQKQEMILITPGIEEVTGYPSEFFYQKGFWEAILHPDDRNTYLHEYSTLVDGRSFTLYTELFIKMVKLCGLKTKRLLY